MPTSDDIEEIEHMVAQGWSAEAIAYDLGLDIADVDAAIERQSADTTDYLHFLGEE
jgi:uncharacterized protein (DUF433 family)